MAGLVHQSVTESPSHHLNLVMIYFAFIISSMFDSLLIMTIRVYLSGVEIARFRTEIHLKSISIVL